MLTRPREIGDLGLLEAIARRVHACDGYPPYLPDEDFAGFLDSAEALAAWAATSGSTVVGQVALHSGSSRAVLDLAAERIGVRPDQLGVVARLLVDPSHRRVGAAQALLAVAEQDALDRGLVPILDVVEQFSPAIALYERQGWKRIGTVRVDLPGGKSLNEHVYVGRSA